MLRLLTNNTLLGQFHGAYGAVTVKLQFIYTHTTATVTARFAIEHI
jgi:hypothetical protein